MCGWSQRAALSCKSHGSRGYIHCTIQTYQCEPQHSNILTKLHEKERVKFTEPKDCYCWLYEIVCVISMQGRWSSAVYKICFIFTVLIMSVHLLFPFICHLFPYIFQKYMFRMCNLNAWRRPVIQCSGS